MNALLLSIYQEETPLLSMILQQAALTVHTARSLDSTMESWSEIPMDLILATIQGEPESMVHKFRLLRGITPVPVVVITDQASELYLVHLLEAGVDLVLARPYSVRMLQIYVRNLARRSGAVPFFSLPTLHHGELRLDPATREVMVGENPPQHLTQLEFRLLYTLMTHAGQTLPAETLVESVWGYEGEGNRELVRGLVQRLRAKVDHDPQGFRYIVNLPGIGYRFEIREKEEDTINPSDRISNFRE